MAYPGEIVNLPDVAAGIVTPAHFNDTRALVRSIQATLGINPHGNSSTVAARLDGLDDEFAVIGADVAALDTRIDTLEAAGGGGGGAGERSIFSTTPGPYTDVNFSSSDPWKILTTLPQVTPTKGIMFHIRGMIYSSTGAFFLRIGDTNNPPANLPMSGVVASYGSSHRLFTVSFWFPWVGLGAIQPRVWARFAAGPGNFSGMSGTVYGGADGSGMAPVTYDYEVI